jgi:hypothetical protein
MTNAFSSALKYQLTLGSSTVDLTAYLEAYPDFHMCLLHLSALCAPQTLLISVEQTFEEKYQDGWGDTFVAHFIPSPKLTKDLEEHRGETVLRQKITPFLQSMPHHQNQGQFWVEGVWNTPPSAHTLLMAKTYIQETQHRFS